MSQEEFLASLDALGLNRLSGARALRISYRQMRNYADGFFSPPFVVAALLRLMLKKEISVATLEEMNRS